MSEKIHSTEYDPQYGWVVADKARSGKFIGFDKAAELYNQLYAPEYDKRGKQTNALNKYYTKGFDQRDPYATGWMNASPAAKDPGEDLMRWYLAASNPELMADEAAKNIILAQGRQFSTDPWRANPAAIFGQQPVDPYQAALSTMRKDLGRTEFQRAMDAVNLAQYVEPARQPTSLADMHASKLSDPSARLQNILQQRRNTEGTIPFQKMLEANPLMYANAYLTRYTDSPNATLVSNDGGSFITRPATNLSKTMGGEDLAGATFQYYQDRAKAGELGQDWTQLTDYPNLQQGTFGGQQSYFTPYDYAIHGVPTGVRGQDVVTNMSSLSPEYWEQHGNLQKLGDQWGFVTSANPYAQPVTYQDLTVPTKAAKTPMPYDVTTTGTNQVLSPEKVQYVEKNDKSWFNLPSALTLGAQVALGGLNPLGWGLGVSAPGWPGTIGTIAGLTSGSDPKRPATWQRDVVAPNYNPYGYKTGGLAAYRRHVCQCQK